MTWTAPAHDPRRELRDHLPEEGWRAAVEAVLAAHGLSGPARPFETGSDVVWGTEAHVVKLTAPCWADEIDAEARCLRHVSGRLSVATPEPVATGTVGGWPYVVATRIAGTAIGVAWPRLARDDRLRLAADLGRLTRELHALPTPDGPDGWDEFWRRCRNAVGARHAESGAPEHLVRAIDAFLDAAGPLDGGERVLLHTELLDQHVLVRDRGGRVELAGLLDFADGRVGPPEYEFAAPTEFVFRGEPGLLRAYLVAYGEDPDALGPARSRRMLAWALSHRFGRLRRMVEATGPPVPADLDELAARLYGLAV